MVSIDTPRKRIALSLSITIIALSLAGSTAFATTKTTSIKKISPVTHAIIKKTTKRTFKVKGASTSAARAKTVSHIASILTQYTVVSGDTISGIAEKFSVDESDILDLNGLVKNDKIHIGAILVIPVDAPSTLSIAPTPSINQSAMQTPSTASIAIKVVTALRGGYYAQPVTGILTQGIHDINAVDFGCPIGTDVHAAATGTVFIAKNNDAYNGGYGNYIVINHPNGTQTLYAHLSQVSVTVGQTVTQGQLIGLSGMTGRATGPHLHVEVRGAMNPWGDDALGTHYTTE